MIKFNTNPSIEAGSVAQSKRESVLTAVSALTALGQSDLTNNMAYSSQSDTHEEEDDKSVEKVCSTEMDSSAEQDDKLVEKCEQHEDARMTFPQKLMEILSNEGHSDIISWLPHGLAFRIHHKRKFVKEVMPLYFKESKFPSFTRKLNRWGFVRVSKGPEMGAYYHNLFQQGNSKNCTLMSCQKKSQQYNAIMKSSSWNPGIVSGIHCNQFTGIQAVTPQGFSSSSPVPLLNQNTKSGDNKELEITNGTFRLLCLQHKINMLALRRQQMQMLKSYNSPCGSINVKIPSKEMSLISQCEKMGERVSMMKNSSSPEPQPTAYGTSKHPGQSTLPTAMYSEENINDLGLHPQNFTTSSSQSSTQTGQKDKNIDVSQQFSSLSMRATNVPYTFNLPSASNKGSSQSHQDIMKAAMEALQKKEKPDDYVKHLQFHLKRLQSLATLQQKQQQCQQQQQEDQQQQQCTLRDGEIVPFKFESRRDENITNYHSFKDCGRKVKRASAA